MIEKPYGSNSTETELSRVNARTETRFLIKEGEIRMSRRESEREFVGREAEPTAVIGKAQPSPTMIVEGVEGWGGEESIPDPEPMCEDAPLSRIHSPPGADGGCTESWLRAAINAA